MNNKTILRAIWWLALVVAPAILLVVELFHPAGFTKDPGMFAYLSNPEAHTAAHHALAYPGPHWWFLLHFIQTPLVVLVAVGLVLLLAGIDAEQGMPAFWLAWIARLCLFVFVVYYTALDAIGGMGMGRAVEITNAYADGSYGAVAFSPEQVEVVARVLDTLWVDPWVGGQGSFVSLTGSWAIFFASLAAALALFLAKKAPWPALVLLVAFGWVLQVSHTTFHGPVAFGLLLATSLILAWDHHRKGEPVLP